MSETPMIAFEDVHKSFGPRKVLDGMAFEIGVGETICIVGTSGAGKSVTLKHMIRLLTPDKGRVMVAGEAISEADGSDLRRLRSKFGYLFQSAALLQWLSVGENVALPLREHTKMKDKDIEDKVRGILAKVDLDDAYHKYPSDISGGMQKRAGLARAIIFEPEIILYDEPTSGLDPVTSRAIDHLICDLQTELGVTNVVVTHDMISALKIANRIVMLHKGRMIESSPPTEFVRSDNPVVRGFLDSQYIDRDFMNREEL